MNPWVRCFLAVLSGVLGSLVFAPVGWGWLAVVAWVPLFAAIQGSSVAVGGRLGMLCGLVVAAGCCGS